MKRAYSIWLVLLTTLCLAVVGCSKKDEVNTSGLEKNFQSSEPSLKSSADKAVSEIKAGDYSAALATLQGLASQAKLTPAQQQAINDTIAQIKDQLAKAANQAVEGGKKAMDDLQKSLPK